LPSFPTRRSSDLKINEHRYQHRHYYFWQDHNGLEVDLLRKTAEAFDAYEIKATQTLTSELFKGLHLFSDVAKPATVHTHLIYGGEGSLTRSITDVLGWKNAR